MGTLTLRQATEHVVGVGRPVRARGADSAIGAGKRTLADSPKRVVAQLVARVGRPVHHDLDIDQPAVDRIEEINAVALRRRVGVVNVVQDVESVRTQRTADIARAVVVVPRRVSAVRSRLLSLAPEAVVQPGGDQTIRIGLTALQSVAEVVVEISRSTRRVSNRHRKLSRGRGRRGPTRRRCPRRHAGAGHFVAIDVSEAVVGESLSHCVRRARIGLCDDLRIAAVCGIWR